MSFTEQRAKQDSHTKPKSSSDYLREYFLSEVVDKLEAMKDKCVIHLYEDLAVIPAPFDFKSFLDGDYNNANEEAATCLSFTLNVKSIYPKFIKPWTDAALKCFDHFLLIYVQDVRKETIKKTTANLKERDVYSHLIKAGGLDQEIGQAFSTIYQYRSEFQHVQYEENNGRRVIRRVSHKRLADRKILILGEFKKALSYFHIMEKN
jgi:hypothetical protein